MEKFIPPIFPVAAQRDPSVAEEEESTKRQFSIALKAAHCSQRGGCLLSVSSGAWQWWLCVYISVRCDGASWLKWRQIPQRDWLRKPICCLTRMWTRGMGAFQDLGNSLLVYIAVSGNNTIFKALKNAFSLCKDWGMLTKSKHCLLNTE